MTSNALVNNSGLAIYPTLVIGLGGAGTNVVRHVKQRFMRSWQQDDLPDILQVLAVDTEPLVNRAGETPLFFNEFAFLGKFDATKLVANRKHHPYLSWWGDDRDIPLGYVHNGAKQLRPIGRLAFFRNYLVFQKLMTDKVRKMLALRAIQEAEQRGFEVMRNHRLIFIVSSLCGGTGAGMFLDVAHRVRHEVGSNATIIGIFFLPSVFEGTISSHIQRRRIRANAYAALKELEYFHETQSFKAFYPGEQTPLPTVPYRAFTRMFLVDIFNSEGVTLSDKSQVEKMAAHFIHLLTFSPLNKDIIGQDVNAHSSEEVTSSGRHRNFSAFACAAVVMPQADIVEYLVNAATQRVCEFLKDGGPQRRNPWGTFLQLRDQIKSKFRIYADSADFEGELDGLSKDLNRGVGRWLDFAQEISRKMSEVFEASGLEGLRDFAHWLTLKQGDPGIKPDHLGDPSQFPLKRVEKPVARARAGWRERLFPHPEDVILTENESVEYKTRQAEFRKVSKAEEVWKQLLEKIGGFAARYESWAKDNLVVVNQARRRSVEQATNIMLILDPLSPGEKDNTTTIYEMETGAMRSEYAHELLRAFDAVLSSDFSSGNKTSSGWLILRTHVFVRLAPRHSESLREFSEGSISDIVRQAFMEPPLNDVLSRMRKAFDIRNIVYIQYAQEAQNGHGVVPPYFVLNRLMGTHVRPFAFADPDLRPFSYADADPIWVVGVPGDGKNRKGEVDQKFEQLLREFGEFKPVYTEDGDRMDACAVVHGLPLELISSLPDMYSQYHGGEFPKSLLHLETHWTNFPEIYTPPDSEAETQATQEAGRTGKSSVAETRPTRKPGQASSGQPSPRSAERSEDTGAV